MAVITYLTPRHRRILFLHVLGLLAGLGPVTAQGSFPDLENVSENGAVSVDPGDATCGVPEQSTFCQAAHAEDELGSCTRSVCVQDCPYGSSTPHYTSMLHAAACPTDGDDDCSVTSAPVLGPGGSFTVAVWLKPEDESEM